MEIKINQKLSAAQVAEINNQLKNNVIHVLNQRPVDNKVSADMIMCKVKRIMPLHSKVVVMVDDNSLDFGKKDALRLTKLSDGYVLMPA